MSVAARAPLSSVLTEYDEIEQKVADGEICSFDGKPCDLERVTDRYGEDADGNRGILVEYRRCRKCGEGS